MSDTELAWLADRNTGLATVCKYLPSVADIHEFIRAKRAKAEQFKPAHTAYRKLTQERGPWEAETDVERKKQVVKELLGYNPMKEADAPKRELVNPTAAEVEAVASSLKSEKRPISREFRALLEEQGWFEYLASRRLATEGPDKAREYLSACERV